MEKRLYEHDKVHVNTTNAKLIRVDLRRLWGLINEYQEGRIATMKSVMFS